MDYVQGSLHRHEALKQQILSHPELVGIEKQEILSIQTEYPLIKRKHVIARPDIVIFYKSARGVCKMFVEVKSGNCRYALEDLHMQLQKIVRYLRYKHLDGDVVGVYPSESSLKLLQPFS